jgi:hypothetical protein
MFGGNLSAGFKEQLLSTPNISFSKQKNFQALRRRRRADSLPPIKPTATRL